VPEELLDLERLLRREAHRGEGRPGRRNGEQALPVPPLSLRFWGQGPML
jgi:hypothetical protein